MNVFLCFLLAVVFTLSGILFDSDLVKGGVVPYPIIFFSLAALASIVLYLMSTGRFYISRSLRWCIALFFLIVIHGVLASLSHGGSSLLAMSSKILTYCFIILMLIFGYNFDVPPKKSLLMLGRFFLIMSISTVVSISLLDLQWFNNNWLAITLLFSLIVFSISTCLKDIFFFFILIGCAFFSFVFLKCRGVTLASMAGALVVIFCHMTIFFKKSIVARMLLLYMISIMGIVASIGGVILYNSSWYAEFTRLSLQYTGKNLDSSRLERWNAAYEFFRESPVLGWGIDAHIARLSSLTDYGDLHSFWWEVAFRYGVIGIFLYLFIFFILANNFSRYPEPIKGLCFFLIFFVLSSVYDLGGVTHWPGTFWFWFSIGLILKKIDYKKSLPYS